MAIEPFLDTVLLEPDQEELLCGLAEAARNVPREQKQKFFVIQPMGKQARVLHPGLPDGEMDAYLGDLETLAHGNLILLSQTPGGTRHFDVAPLAFRYYERVKKQQGEPVQRIETAVKCHFDAARFQEKYPNAYQKWASADSILWESDSEQQLTEVGHKCREAMQAFATALVNAYEAAEVDQDKSHTVARVRAVLDSRATALATTEKAFLDALIAYWGTVNDLIQRQEHGAQKEGGPLVWEDARRVVFQTALVMFEIDSALSHLHDA